MIEDYSSCEHHSGASRKKSNEREGRQERSRHIQLQQDSVRVAVDEALPALQAEVLLEGTNSFGVVSLQAADNLGDLGRALLWVFMLRIQRHGGRLWYGCSIGGVSKLLRGGEEGERRGESSSMLAEVVDLDVVL